MAITGNASYVPTTNDFLAHWSDVNAALPGPSPLILRSGMARAGLVTARDDLQTLLDAVQDELNDVELARAALDLLKVPLLGRLNEFNGILDAYYQGTKFHAGRPLAPGITEGEEGFTEPLRDMKSLWLKLNAAPAVPGVTLPLLLDGGLTQAQFVTLLGDLRTAYADVADAEQDLKLSRSQRDALMGVIYEALKAYRLAVPARLPNNAPLLATLPKLTPDAGHTPDAVNASAVFVAPNQFRVVYDASTDADLKEYQLRGNAGATFKSEDAVVIATNGPAATREFLSGFALTQPGAKVSVSVYVITNAGNEKGSTPMTVTRPAA